MHGPPERPGSEGPLAAELDQLQAALDAEDFQVGLSGALGTEPVKAAVEHIGFEHLTERLFQRGPEGPTIEPDIAHALGGSATRELLDIFMDASLAASLENQSRAEHRKEKTPSLPRGQAHKYLVDEAATLPTAFREVLFPVFEGHVAFLFLALQSAKNEVLPGWLASAVVSSLAQGCRAALFFYGCMNLPSSGRARERSPSPPADLAAASAAADAIDRFAKEGAKAIEAGAKVWPSVHHRDE